MKILDRLIGSLRGCCHSLPDLRQGGGTRYTMADMSAFSLFFLQSPSFLAHQRRLEEGQGRSNCQTLFGLTATFARKSRSDFGLRCASRPDAPLAHRPPSPATIISGRSGQSRPLSSGLRRGGGGTGGGLEAFRQLGGHVLIALDGTEYHVSSKVHCQHCSTRKRGKDKTEHFHALVSATVVAPDNNRVVPLEPEFIVPQDGHEKQDCESRAVRRWL